MGDSSDGNSNVEKDYEDFEDDFNVKSLSENDINKRGMKRKRKAVSQNTTYLKCDSKEKGEVNLVDSQEKEEVDLDELINKAVDKIYSRNSTILESQGLHSSDGNSNVGKDYEDFEDDFNVKSLSENDINKRGMKRKRKAVSQNTTYLKCDSKEKGEVNLVDSQEKEEVHLDELINKAVDKIYSRNSTILESQGLHSSDGNSNVGKDYEDFEDDFNVNSLAENDINKRGMKRKRKAVSQNTTDLKCDSKEKGEVNLVDPQEKEEVNLDELINKALDKIYSCNSTILESQGLHSSESIEKVGIETENLQQGTPIIEEAANSLNKLDSEKQILKFFWWDAYEDPKTQPGTVILFGKTYCIRSKKFISCSVVVRNIYKKIYLLPRKYCIKDGIEDKSRIVAMAEVHQEFNNTVATVLRSQTIRKRYVSDSSIPFEREYLEVEVEGNINTSNREFSTISQIFGLNSNSFLEIFLLKQKIKGPCWLKITNFKISTDPITHSVMEIECSEPQDVSLIQTGKPIPPPTLTALTINIKTAIDLEERVERIVMISCLVSDHYFLDKKAQEELVQDHFCVLSKVGEQKFSQDLFKAVRDYKLTRVQKMDTEKALLNYFLNKFAIIDPDLIVGHDLIGCQFTNLTKRLIETEANSINRLSKIKLNYRNYSNESIERALFSGRLVCDVKISAKELIKARSYNLDTLCCDILKIPEGQRIVISPEGMPQRYENPEDLLESISSNMQDARYILRIMVELNIIPLALEITNIAGNLMSKTLMGGRSERNDFLLLHAFNENNYIIPEKIVKKSKENLKQEETTYAGGLVLEPKVGFYDKLILHMDFNSLYPSIIQEYNICFTTVKDLNNPEIEEIELPKKNLRVGILPTEIGKLVVSRREVKNLMKNPDLSPDLYMQYNIKQIALKLLANNIYGCLAFPNSRFFAKKLAALITKKGREILTNTRDTLKKLNFDVLYGDTDSIMINTNITDYEQVLKIGENIKQEINKLYQKIELDIDGIFKYLLLLKKKRYAAVTLTKDKNQCLTETLNLKGLDIVRRDWSQVAVNVGKEVLNYILSDQSDDKKIENILKCLSKLKEDIQNEKVPFPMLIMNKQLTKNPDLYKDKTLSHVQVALRNNNTKSKKFKGGDTVSYIICKDGTNNPATQRAYTFEEIMDSSELFVDLDYYIAQQIYPVISRICEPLQGIDKNQLKRSLGLEKEGYYTLTDHPYAKFENAEPFVFKCLVCKVENKLTGLLLNRRLALEKCCNFKCNALPINYVSDLKNQLTVTIKGYIQKCHKKMMYCEDLACSIVTNNLLQNFSKSHCPYCKNATLVREYSEESLYYQLRYLQNMFNISKIGRTDVDPKIKNGYDILKETVDEALKNQGFTKIDLFKMFSHFHRPRL